MSDTPPRAEVFYCDNCESHGRDACVRRWTGLHACVVCARRMEFVERSALEAHYDTPPLTWHMALSKLSRAEYAVFKGLIHG